MYSFLVATWVMLRRGLLRRQKVRVSLLHSHRRSLRVLCCPDVQNLVATLAIHPSFWLQTYKNEVHVLPMKLDGKVAHLRRYTLHHAIIRWHGRDLTEYFPKNLTERRYSFTASAVREIVRDVKEKLRCFGADCKTELKSTSEINKVKTYELPDGNIMSVGAECFRCVVAFSSRVSLAKKPADPRHFLTKCDVDTRKKLYANVVPSGGTAIFQGLSSA